MNFEEMKNVNIMNVNSNDLVDIRSVKVNSEIPKNERIIEFIKQIKNPYCYKCGEIIIKISFSETGETIENCLEKIFKI